ncbi:MAG TPA: terminase large subunit, partial [Alicycliphilus sp.]|nr:terminase large subunit [Alicycliphilus sp.]
QGLHDRARRDRAPYDVWVKQGYLRTTPGASVDYGHVAQDLLEILADLDVQAIAYDRWRIDIMRKELDRLGAELPLIEWGQGYKDMAPALDALEAELLNHRIAHGGHPVLQMCASNARVVKDPTGARKLDKSRATGRIDGMQALAMAMGAASRATESQSVGFDAFTFV